MPRPVTPATQDSSSCLRPRLVVLPGEIVGLVAPRAGDATPLLLDVATRAMTDGTPALVLDVPFERMDHEARVVATAIARSAALGGAAVVIVAHRHATLAHLAQRVIVLGADAPDPPATVTARDGPRLH